MVDISIVIRCKNEGRFIENVLEKIYDQDIDKSFEVIVIDSGSTDRTIDIVKKYPVRLYEIDGRRFTFGYALNYGVSLARGKYIAFLSAHCIPATKNWLSTLMKDLTDPAIAATFGRQEPIPGLNHFEEVELAENFPPDENKHIEILFSNANCIIKREIIEKYPFDEEIAFYEDFLWAMGIKKIYKIKYVYESSVYHSHPFSIKYWSKRFYNSCLAREYLKYVYGLDTPQKKPKQTPKAFLTSFNILQRILRAVAIQTHTALFYMTYFSKKGYLHFIPLIPLFLTFREYYGQQGKKVGKKLYGNCNGKKAGIFK